MYQDDTITTEFTGYWDSTDQEYVYPSAPQNFMLFNGIPADYELTGVPSYLSASDGDFSTDGVTITYSVGAKEDISIGQALAATMSGTILNEGGYLNDFSFSSLCQAWIGVVTGTESVTMPTGTTCYIAADGHVYHAIGGAGFKDGAKIFSGSTAVMSITRIPGEDDVNDEGVAFWLEDGSTWYYIDASHIVPPGTPGWKHSDAGYNFYSDKYTRTPQSVAFPSYNALGPMHISTWDVESGSELKWTYIPMGVFDMSSVSVYGTAYTFEVYDRMLAFDVPATDWINNLDFTTPKTVSSLLQELMANFGFYDTAYQTARYTIDSNAVNTSLAVTSNPFANNTITFRQIISWIAESMACNACMERNGYVKFFNYAQVREVGYILPDTIVSQSRDFSRYLTPAVTSLTVYGVDGTYYTSGTQGTDYYIVGNPLLDTSNTTAIDNILRPLRSSSSYNTTAFTDACADPRYDAGDWIRTKMNNAYYPLPIMHQTIVWRGNCVAEISATGSQAREAPTEAERTDYEAAVNRQKLDEYVRKDGDTMTGDLENTSVSTRRTVMQGNRFYVENTNDTEQNAGLFYNGISTTNGTNTVTVTPGGVDIDGTLLTSGIGSTYKSPSTTVSVPTATYTEVASFTLTKGVWLIEAFVRFASNATGRRTLALSATSGSGTTPAYDYAQHEAAVNGTQTSVRVTVIRSVGATTTLYMNAYQNSGSALSTDAIYCYVRVF